MVVPKNFETYCRNRSPNSAQDAHTSGQMCVYTSDGKIGFKWFRCKKQRDVLFERQKVLWECCMAPEPYETFEATASLDGTVIKIYGYSTERAKIWLETENCAYDYYGKPEKEVEAFEDKVRKMSRFVEEALDLWVLDLHPSNLAVLNGLPVLIDMGSP